MSRVVLIVCAVAQVVCGIIIIGLFAKVYRVHSEYLNSSMKALWFGPILAGILSVVTGVLGVIAVMKASWNLGVAYLMMASATLVSHLALVYEAAVQKGWAASVKYMYTIESYLSAGIAFAALGALASLVVVIILGRTTCHREYTTVK